MTHGRAAKTSINTRSKKGSQPLTRFLEQPENSLESRVARLEARVEQMQQEIDRASGAMPSHFHEAIQGKGKKLPGPEQKIDQTELLLRRDNLVNWLEEHWPKVVGPLLAAKNPPEVTAVLRTIAAAPGICPEWQSDFIECPAELLDFLHSRKFRVKPPTKTVIDALFSADSQKRKRAANRLPTRRVANAMAGVPKLKWRTSLDKCSRHPSSAMVGYKSAKHYQIKFGVSPRASGIEPNPARAY
jgi:hypothetical protein